MSESHRGRGRPPKRGRTFRNARERLLFRNRLSVHGNHLGKENLNFRSILLNVTVIEEHNLGTMSIQCENCHALHFSDEATNGHFNACCHNGLISLPEPLINTELKDMLNVPNYVENIRNYNSAMAFASFSAKTKDIPGRGPYCFKIQGQVHRYISDLLPLPGSEASYGQLYFIDSLEATYIRMGRSENKQIQKSILTSLSAIMDNNPYAQAYKSAAEIMKNETAGHSVDLCFVDSISLDKRRFNKPSANEIAGIFNSAEGEPPGNRCVVIHHQQSGPKLLPVTSPHCDPMIYPLLFPFGEPGWDIQMTHNGPRKQAKRDRLSMLQFACYRLAIRGTFSHIHQSKKLFQQYIVDLYVRVEGERLNYIRYHQSELRVEHYKGLQDFVVQRGQLENLIVGKIVVLPSTFEGSPRNMTLRYQDAMAIVRKYGKPDIFLTMTCNPNWPEITSELSANEKPADRPDIVSRVFRCKLNALKEDLLKNNSLGVVIAHVYVIEFQKRGLPHCHMLLILDEQSKFREPSDIDLCVSAEIPDPTLFPVLHQRVLSSMIHGPCGVRNPSASCMVDGKCSKKYPKDFLENTIENHNGYPKYRRQDNGITVQKGVHEINNRDVVPYNSFLLLKYNAHINVEICSSVRSVKYLFKYVYKGYDSASMAFVRNIGEGNEVQYDEIVNHVNMRYVSSHECIWRLHCNEMHEQSHTIVRLAVHADGFHNVYFREGSEEHAIQVAESKRTTLTAWFDLNRAHLDACQYFYSDIPQHYRFVNNKWVPRKRGGSKVIGRMYGVAPNDQERFYIRMLLLHVKGAKCFADLRSFNDVTYNTFKAAALARGLLEDDTEWHNCLEEMHSTHMPQQLRELYSYICCFCEPASPYDLWTTFKSAMMEDFEGLTADEAENAALQDIDSILRANGIDCKGIGLPQPSTSRATERVYNNNEEAIRGNDMYCKLNREQKLVVDRILNATTGETENKLFFLEAPGGCGKTFVYSCILSIVRGRGLTALAAAWTGIAALLLDGGTTLHRLFGLPVPITSVSVSSIKANSDRAAVLRQASVILIDEASMVPAAAVDCIDRLLRDIMRCQDPKLGDVEMGGKVILFGGDFRQVLPVVPMASKVQILESCIQNSKIWKSIIILQLTVNMRASASEQGFSEWLLQLGNGTLQSHHHPESVIEIPQDFVCKEDSIVRRIFGDSLKVETVQDYANRVIVTPLNDNCHHINKEVLDLLPGDSMEYCSVDSIITDDPAEKLNIPLEFLNSITPSGMPPHKLILKVGAIVMLIRNMNLGSGLVNGVRMVVRGLMERCIKLEVITGAAKGNIILMPRIKLRSTDPNMPFSMARLQFPLRLSFAMTINKAQGQTFQKLGIYLPKPVFTHGQLYVAFSRVSDPKDVQVVIQHSNVQEEDHDRIYTLNILYREILL